MLLVDDRRGGHAQRPGREVGLGRPAAREVGKRDGADVRGREAHRSGATRLLDEKRRLAEDHAARITILAAGDKRCRRNDKQYDPSDTLFEKTLHVRWKNHFSTSKIHAKIPKSGVFPTAPSEYLHSGTIIAASLLTNSKSS
jgi:hypothetical protein